MVNKLPPAQHSYLDFLNVSNTPVTSFAFELVIPDEVKQEISRKPNDKSFGLYSCPTKILKSSAYVISSTLAQIINLSISTGVYPKKLKMANIIPIFKADDNTDANNYRPISLLSNFNRIFEKLICNRMESFIEKNNLFSPSQNGFCKAHSTQHAILDIVNTMQTNMDNHLFSCGVFVDLKKAFDTVDPKIHLDKLYHYGFRGIINKWFSSYLEGRAQTTQIGSFISPEEIITFGVPQGSVLGPLLFLIYINDIQECSEKLQFFIFANDTNILYADNNLKSLEDIVNLELRKLCDWLTANKLTLNIKETNFVIFCPAQRKLTFQPNITIFKYVSLERKEFVKYLGIFIDQNLTWKHHIDHVALKISRYVGLLSKLRHPFPTHTLITIYRSLISPHLTYGLLAWGQACKSHLEKLLKLQKCALRFIYFSDFKQHAPGGTAIYGLYRYVPL